jgi:hypothetical protein
MVAKEKISASGILMERVGTSRVRAPRDALKRTWWEDDAMKWVRGLTVAAVTAVMVLAGFVFLASLSDGNDYAAVYGSQAGAPSAHRSAAAE